MGQQFTVKSMLRGLEGKLGDDDYIEPLEILVDSINKHNKFNIFGKVAFNPVSYTHLTLPTKA